jgi:predicted O-methyltransferase YrrM
MTLLKMQIHINDLFVSDLVSDLVKHVNWSDDGKLIEQPPGNQHYRLLAHISNSLPDGAIVFEIGTRWCVSAVALSRNPNINVVTCDIEKQFDMTLPSNVEFILGDGFEVLENYIHANVIFMDVDPHDGIQERKMIKKLSELNFKGILVLDDIHLNKEMNDVWNEIDLDKFDATQIGHYSGTGIVFFGDQSFSVLQTIRKKT